jgi:alanyl-tRNA synthetase
MTERVYLQDPYVTTFRARVIELRDLDGKPAAVLDRSAFYPEGGGQPGDRGVLGAAKVLDTQEQAGEVLHLLDRPLALGEVDAQVDWQRRFDHMQQHHGQHLLSAAFETVGLQTISFHLGERSCTIDLDSPPDLVKARTAETRANESIWRDLPIVARDFVGDERAKLPLRKEAVKGDRVVLVEGVDASPCGGTHPKRTGEVGCVSILKVQRWGDGKSRVEFVCGGRVVSMLAEANAQLTAAAEVLKTGPADLTAAVTRVAAEAQTRRKQAEGLLTELAQHEAARLKAPLVVARIERGAAFARTIAQTLSQQGSTVLLGAVEEGRGHLIFARPKGASGPAMGALLKESLAILNGKGGGNPDFAQGSGEPDKLDEALALARSKLV